MIAKAMEKIEALVKSASYHTEIVEDRTYIVGPDGYELMEAPQADTVHLNTLSGVADFIASNSCSTFATPFQIVVDSATHITVCTALDKHLRTREKVCVAEAEVPSFDFGRYMPVENMIVALNSNFVRDDETEALCAAVSSITDSKSVHLSDDGVTQTATVRSGVALAQTGALRPIRTLRPVRTFVEAEQPASEFLLRARPASDKDGAPLTVALFEADGGAWKKAARNNVRDALKKLIDAKDLMFGYYYILA